MPRDYRSVTAKVSATVVGSLLQLEELATKAIGVTLSNRGWSLLSCLMNSDGVSAKVTFRRSNERDRGFAETTAVQWTDIQRRFAAALSSCSGWYSDDLPAVVAARAAVAVAPFHPVAIDEWRCSQCGIDNSNRSDCCMVCCSSRVAAVATTSDDSELQRLLDAVETAQSNLRKFLARR